MARTKQIQRAVTPRSATSRGGRPVSRPALAGLVTSTLAAFWAVAMLTSFGQVLYVYLFVFTEYYAGVVVLVLLSLTVMAGLVATDRLVLMIRHRVLLQSTHRAMGTIAIGALVLHILTKIALGRAGALDPVLPFVSGRGLYIGLGTVAGYLMVSVLWTGIVRARFAGKGKPWMWRALHSGAYVSWPIALAHGLNAGRPPATWVVLSYLACVLLVVAAMIVRVSVSLGRKRKEGGQTTSAMKPIGIMAEDAGESRGSAGGAAKRRPGARVSREEDWYSGLRAKPGDPMSGSWGSGGESPVRETRRRPANRFAVPEVPRRRLVEDAPPVDPWEERGGRVYPPPAAEEEAPAYQPPAPEEPWDSPRRWSAATEPAPTDDSFDSASTNYWERPKRWSAEAEPAPRRGRRSGARHSREDEETADFADDPVPVSGYVGSSAVSGYVPSSAAVPVDDDTPTLINLASRRAMRDAEGGSSRSRRKRAASEVDGAYWTRLRGEAQ